MTYTLKDIRSLGEPPSHDTPYDDVEPERDWDAMVPPEDPYAPSSTDNGAAASGTPATTAGAGQYLADRRPVVLITRDDAAAIARAAVDALASATRGGHRYIYRKVDAKGAPTNFVTTEPNGSPKIWTEGEASALLYSVLQPAKNGQTLEGGVFFGEYAAAFPVEMAKAAYRTALHSHSIPMVKTIATSPVLLPDGTVASKPGYDEATQVLVNISDDELAQWSRYSVPERPTLAQAQAAIDYVLTELLADFPFESDEDRAVALCYFMTCASRHLYGATPFFAFDAPERGTGKTLLATLGFIISQGSEDVADIEYRRTKDDEIRKQFVALYLDGGSHAHVDEVKKGERVDSLFLTSVTTKASVTLRVLGGNQQVAVSGIIGTFCGNNIQVGGDMGRRFMKSRLKFVGTHAASQRKGFRHKNIRRWLHENRPEVLAALHTALAYGIQNRVQPNAVLGSYEEWTDVVLGALEEVTLNGASITSLAMTAQLALAHEQDEDAEEWGELLAYIHNMLEGRLQNDPKASPWSYMAAIFEMVTNTIGVTPPTFPEALQVAMAANTNVGKVKAWTKRFQSILETPMVWGDEAYRVHEMRDTKNRPMFRVEKIEGWASMPSA